VPRGPVPIDGPRRIFLVNAHTRDVSSTTIRERLASGLPIDDMVPEAVARHIHKHHLYGAVDDLHGEDERI
jgi:nicotinate-nucleotide adenylyltransferase